MIATDKTPPRGVPVARVPAPATPPPRLTPATAADATPPRGHPAVRLSAPAVSLPPTAEEFEDETPFFQGEEKPGAPAAPATGEHPREGAAPPSLMADLPEGQWLYLVGGKEHGPVELDELIDLILAELPDSTLVWSQGLERWTRASQVPEIAEQIPPPLPEVRPEPGRALDFPEFNTVPAMLRTVLIADENPEFRKFLGMPLLAQGFRVFEAGNGEEAWALAEKQRPWLILSDVRMPELDGFEVCRRVRAHSLLSHRPFLFISGSDNYKDRYRGLQVGADDFLSKQTPIRELLIRVQLLLTRYADLGPKAKVQGPAGAPEATGAAMEGQIEVIGPPGTLQICNQGRFTGIFTARTNFQRAGDPPGGRTIEIRFRDGDIVGAATEGLSGPEAVYDFLAWPRGHFKFVPGDPGDALPIASSVEHLLLEGCRLLDEKRKPEVVAGEGE